MPCGRKRYNAFRNVSTHIALPSTYLQRQPLCPRSNPNKTDDTPAFRTSHLRATRFRTLMANKINPPTMMNPAILPATMPAIRASPPVLAVCTSPGLLLSAPLLTTTGCSPFPAACGVDDAAPPLSTGVFSGVSDGAVELADGEDDRSCAVGKSSNGNGDSLAGTSTTTGVGLAGAPMDEDSSSRFWTSAGTSRDRFGFGLRVGCVEGGAQAHLAPAARLPVFPMAVVVEADRAPGP